jgi:hypothetical protein
MITAVRIVSNRAVSSTVPRAVGATRSFAIGDALASKVRTRIYLCALMRCELMIWIERLQLFC